MRKFKIFSTGLMVFLIVLVIIAPPVLAQKEYKITYAEIEKYKKFPYDDARPLWKDFDIKKIIPPDDYAKITFNEEAMKKQWAEIVGFKAPDVVGKIAPEIKPGTYTYQDKEKYPGLKELMIPELYKRFAPGSPPFAGNFPEIKVIPTRQYYYALPIAEATKKHNGFAKLDDQGYLDQRSYIAGLPFPQPEGKFKAQHIIYNWDKRYYGGDSFFGFGQFLGITKRLTEDNLMIAEKYTLRMIGRVLTEPYGWYDKRAETNGETGGIALRFLAPRDMFGSAMSQLYYIDPTHLDLALFYIGGMRRIRKMSTTDTQDAVSGQDVIYDDNQGFSQKLNPKLFPYKYEIIGEREFLVPFASIDGAGYLSKKGMELHDYEFERRPTYVVQLTQLDRNYVYSKRIMYIDKETFLLYYIENYDRKGRLYRTALSMSNFRPLEGMFYEYDVVFRDHLDHHTTFGRALMIPTAWMARDNIDLGGMVMKGK